LATRPDPNQAERRAMLGAALGEKDAAAIAAEGAGMKVTCHELISGFGSGDADANS